MLVPGAISNVCVVIYRAQGLPAQDAPKMAKAVRFGERISSECAEGIQRWIADKTLGKAGPAGKIS